MSTTYTLADVRRMVDDLDDTIRAAVARGDVETIFAKERVNFVSDLLDLV